MSLRILIVEDNQDTADTMAFLIEVWGHHPFVAYDGATGWKAACDQRPDCLILDINLPKIDGYTLARRLRKGGLHEAKLVAMSAYSDADHVRRAEEAGFDYLLTKPTDPWELKRLLAMTDQRMQTAPRDHRVNEPPGTSSRPGSHPTRSAPAA